MNNLTLFKCEKIGAEACLWLVERLQKARPSGRVIHVCTENSSPTPPPCPAAGTGLCLRQFGIGITY